MGTMRRTLLPLAVLAALALPLAASAQEEEDQDSQALFTQTLVDDERTTAAIKGLLTEGGGFVDRAMLFGDLTGDGRADAVVRVGTGGAAGAVAVYVLSTDGGEEDDPLRVVYRNQNLYRATTQLANGGLTITQPQFARGDDVAAPRSYVARDYVWSTSTKTLRRKATRTVGRPAGPGTGTQTSTTPAR